MIKIISFRRIVEFLQPYFPILSGGHFPEQQIPLVWLGGAGVLQLELQRQTEQGPDVEVDHICCQ